jgi:glycosyltransferase involved in cell wall biosynthesis
MAHVDPDKNPSRLIAGGSLVTVVIAAFNAKAHIEEACLSALRQTYRTLEVIVVDDGSTDDTSRIVERLAASDSRVRLIRQHNQGVAAARNAAIAAARGEFIAPLDADDLWHAAKVEKQVQRLQECGADTGFVYCWWAWIDVKGDLLDRSPRWEVEGRVLDRLIEVNFTGNASVPMYRASCLEKLGGYDVNLHRRGAQGCEDWDLAIRVAERYGAAVSRAVLVGYRRRFDGMSAACDTMWRSQMQILSELATRQPDVSPAVLRRSRGQFALHLAGVSFWSGNYLQACRWALRARSIPLGLSVAPHVVRLLARRLLHFLRHALHVDARRSKHLAWNANLEEADLPDPLIPYSRIYKRHWDERNRE